MTAKVLKFKTAYGDRKRSGFETTGESLTQQSHAAQADVRNIIKHALIFGYDFPDKHIWVPDKQNREKQRGYELYISPELEELWPHGFHRIGSCTFESAAYVARYVMSIL